MFDVALTELLADGVFHEERWVVGGTAASAAMQFYELEDETVWGATARILTVFLAAGPRPPDHRRLGRLDPRLAVPSEPPPVGRRRVA